MHTYIINNKIVTKQEWTEAFKKNPKATVVLRLPVKQPLYQQTDTGPPIDPEKARIIRENHKKVLT
jgi:hypothetical protein